ncbi:Metalloreductase STEAP4 [Chionoecetes opilio]|uniref:Metalloreductase STEAP4 n=1 Tax=Chionoecetes opilio TaxID=41210 RepID=A0A8J4YK84_CHIOP|nr:Metalloreductase STEAP4 [Chionoecetes opilio]
MARDLRLSPLDMGRLANSREVESIPLRFFPEWHGAFAFSLVIWIAFFLLLVFEWQVCDNIMDSTSDWTSLGLLASTNVPLACGDTALTLLAVCYLPGVIAAYLQLTRGTKYSQFPGWLDRWLKSRKQLGLLMLLNALLHTLVMFCNSESQLSWTSSWHKNTFLACGCYAILLAGILGLTSLPSVSGSMTWREFSFVQSVLGWLTLLLATLHLVFCYWDKLIKADFKCYLPSSGQFVIVIPLLTIVLKLPLLLPCVDSVLTNIRQGYERPSSHSRTPNNTIN